MSKILIFCCILSLLFVINLAEVPNAGGFGDSKTRRVILGKRSNKVVCIRDCSRLYPNSTASCFKIRFGKCLCYCYVPDSPSSPH
ncbi:unnamed protein product [Coffea canephora]|uniref:Knottin scorpion toxin-like domain-containing protein n=1 Tax=Coffea canephora TaxID=49390 RepID=A0A068TRR6_COFCA|nr:unnamed protein product [Coffea canephora]